MKMCVRLLCECKPDDKGCVAVSTRIAPGPVSNLDEERLQPGRASRLYTLDYIHEMCRSTLMIN
jgi:hypothetical protein